MMTAVKAFCLIGQGRWLFVSLICFGLSIMPVFAMGSILQIQDNVTVAGPKINIMDLGTLDGERPAALIAELKATDLGVAPAPGQVRKLSKDYLASVLKQHHLESSITLKMGTAVAINTEGTCITGETLQKLMEAQLPPYNDNYISRRLIISNLGEGIWLEKGEHQIVVKPLGRVPELGTIVFGIEFFVNQVKKKTIHQSAEIRLTGLVYQAKRAIKPKEKLTEADFRVSAAEIGNRRQYYGGFPEECRAVKKIQPGEILERNSFQQIPPVMKGNLVTAVVRLDGVEIGVTAEAGRDGWMGDEINVKNSKSKQAFKAIVIGRNRVEVKTE